MDAAAWGLIGVVVGAVLSAGAGSYLGHQKWLRESRMEAYAMLLATTNALVHETSVFTFPDAERRHDAANRMNEAHSRVMILAPKTIRVAADKLMAAASTWTADPRDQRKEASYEARFDDLQALARTASVKWRVDRA